MPLTNWREERGTALPLTSSTTRTCKSRNKYGEYTLETEKLLESAMTRILRTLDAIIRKKKENRSISRSGSAGSSDQSDAIHSMDPKQTQQCATDQWVLDLNIDVVSSLSISYSVSAGARLALDSARVASVDWIFMKRFGIVTQALQGPHWIHRALGLIDGLGARKATGFLDGLSMVEWWTWLYDL
ncbi:uncharacterized protein BDV14DRAFT_95516 [Aspergillus stella-maris]|uniref:uncharacterized protein n=1 Tax=Aspergillus stella-maris TaxID=1810926 RepID=UPI003CCD49FE